MAPTFVFGSKHTLVMKPCSPPECCTQATSCRRTEYQAMHHASVHSSFPRYRAACISFNVGPARTWASLRRPPSSRSWKESQRARSSTHDHRPPSAHTVGGVTAGSSSSDRNLPAYPVARRDTSVSGSGSKPVAVMLSGSRIAARTYSAYGLPLVRPTISPSSW